MRLLDTIKKKSNKKSLLKKGNKYLKYGDFDKALKCYDEIIELDPLSADAWYNKSLVFFKIRKYMESIEFFDRSLNLDPENIKALNSKGLALGSIYKYEESYACFDKALELDPDYEPAKKAREEILSL